MWGVNLGPWEAAIGNCQHLKTILPTTWEVTLDTTTHKVGVEMFWNVWDPSYNNPKNVENWELVQLEQVNTLLLEFKFEKHELVCYFFMVHYATRKLDELEIVTFWLLISV